MSHVYEKIKLNLKMRLRAETERYIIMASSIKPHPEPETSNPLSYQTNAVPREYPRKPVLPFCAARARREPASCVPLAAPVEQPRDQHHN